MSEEKDKIKEFIEPGSEIIGGVAGSAIGLLSAGLAGAIVGGAAGPIITRIFRRTCLDLYQRVTGYREKVRGGATAAYALVNISERIKNGESVRDDNFFDSETRRSSADEILEGVIIKSRNDHEEKKAKFYANIFTTSAFDKRFTPESINHALVIAQRLTYRQLCLLHLFSEPQPIQLRNQDYCGVGQNVGWETVPILAEIMDLYSASLLRCLEPGASTGRALIGMSDIYPAWMRRTSVGNRLHHLMQLQTLQKDDLINIAKSLL